jgi:hypothetical protein
MNAMTEKSQPGKPRITAAIIIAVFAVVLEAQEVRAQDDPDIQLAVRRDGDPGFRTDLGFHVAIGGNSCIGGGTGYASCYGADNAWDTSVGVSGGVLLRPLKHFSAGIDITYGRMRYHQMTANKWSDLTFGPVARFHWPIRFKGLYFEPNLGLQVGFVKGVMYENESEQDTSLSREHVHMGAFLALPFGLDFFPLPRLGFGLEFRLIRTIYTDVCFESSGGVACRGIDDEALTDRYDLPFGGVPADKGIEKFPMKLFWGVHGLYYF